MPTPPPVSLSAPQPLIIPLFCSCCSNMPSLIEVLLNIREPEVYRCGKNLTLKVQLFLAPGHEDKTLKKDKTTPIFSFTTNMFDV